MKPNPLIGFVLAIAVGLAFATPAHAVKKKKIDGRVVDALVEFSEIVSNSDDLISRSKGVLVFPRIAKGGLGLGYERGNGAMMVNGQTIEYYRLDSPSIGFQLGIQVRSQIFLFLDQGALDAFRNSPNWEIGVDGSVALVTLDAGGEISTETLDDPVVTFVFDGRGLMYNLTLEGTKFSKIRPK